MTLAHQIEKPVYVRRVPDRWMQLRHLLQPALERQGNTHTLQDVLFEIQTDRDVVFWAGRNCAIVTQLIEYPQRTVLIYWLAGGDLDEIKKMEPAICKYARMHGATMAQIAGRKGWERTLGNDWSAGQALMTREL